MRCKYKDCILFRMQAIRKSVKLYDARQMHKRTRIIFIYIIISEMTENKRMTYAAIHTYSTKIL